MRNNLLLKKFTKTKRKYDINFAILRNLSNFYDKN